LRQGVLRSDADTLISLTLWTVAASIVVHGVSAQPLMQRYLARRRCKPAKATPAEAKP
jgi:NhaP-type Na+/H+ or K+/H+ antiporter